MKKQNINDKEQIDVIKQLSQEEADWIRMKIEVAEKSGFTKDCRNDILNQSKKILLKQ